MKTKTPLETLRHHVTGAIERGEGEAIVGVTADDLPARLEYLRGELRAESMSYGEIAELQSLAPFIPADDVELREAAGIPEFPEKSEYETQAETFLQSNGIKFRATLSNSKSAAWDDGKDGERNHYRVTLSKTLRLKMPEGTRQIPACRLTFDFWGSINDAQQGKHPTAYDVLARISGDVHCPETFADFCADYGYEEDSIKALQTFRRCSRFGKRLQEFFTAAEIEQLQEIQ